MCQLEKDFKVEKCVQGGDGLIRLPNGPVCFAHGALPSEIVEIEITEQKRDFARANVAKILEAHKRRREPPCPYYGKCGGCNAQHAEFDLQIEVLRQIVLDLFLRMAKINLPFFEIHYGTEWGYRHRAQIFAIGNKWGFKARASNTVIPIEKCMVLAETLNGKIGHVFDNQSEKYLGKYIHADENVFFQSNLELLPKLIDEVQKAAGNGEIFLDIFCGVGLFSAFLQDKFERVIAVEQNPLCQKFAEKNLGKNCEFHAISAEEWCEKNPNKSCVLIDPPRTGMSNKLCDNFCKNKAEKLIYVSCNPATLARDTCKLLNAGYKLANIQGFAFYPQTFHLEMMAEFRYSK
jgi:23S rRNA (uracil1939-C5)-methyltransferase